MKRNHYQRWAFRKKFNHISLIPFFILAAVHCQQENTSTTHENIWKTVFSQPQVLANESNHPGFQLALNSTRATKQSRKLVTGPYLTFTGICFIVTALVLVLILSYLNSVALAKECVLSYLYKDLVVVWFFGTCVWNTRAIVSYLNTDSDVEMSMTAAKILAFLSQIFIISLFLTTIIIASIKLYKTKNLMLDPPMPWGDDDARGIKILRTVVVVLSIVVTSTGFLLGQYSRWFYFYIGLEASQNLTDQPFNFHFTIFSAINILMVFSCIALTLLRRYHQSEENELNENSIPHEMDYVFGMMSVFWVVFFTFRFFQYLDFNIITTEMISYRNRLFLFQIFISLLLFTPPVWILLRSSKIRSSTITTIKDTLDDISFLRIYITPFVITILMYLTLYFVYMMFDM